MLGFALHRHFASAGHTVAGTVRAATGPSHPACAGLDYLGQVNGCEFDSVEAAILRFAPSIVVNAIGVKHAADEAGLRAMFAINGVLPRLLAQFTAGRAIRLIHFSTDGVFDGRSGSYDETCRPNPYSFYALSKFVGEPGGRHVLTIRTSMIGRAIGAEDNLVDWALAQRGASIAGFSNVRFSGLPVHEIANFLHDRVLAHGYDIGGLFHLAASPVDKYSLLTMVLERWGIKDVHVESRPEPCSDLSLKTIRGDDFGGYRAPEWPRLIHEMHQFYVDAGLQTPEGGKIRIQAAGSTQRPDPS